MQFIENSVLGGRAAYYILKSPLQDKEIHLFPMIHIGEASYYSEIKSKLDDLDFIIFEGVKSKKSKLITASYEILTKKKSLGVITQNEGLSLSNYKHKLIHGDINSHEFDKNFKILSFRSKFILLILAPIYGMYQYLTATKYSIFQNIERDDLLTRDEIMNEDDLEQEILEVILHKRDDKLISIINSTLENNIYNGKKIAIIYGARHMRAITQYLMHKYNYKIHKSQWLTIFNY